MPTEKESSPDKDENPKSDETPTEKESSPDKDENPKSDKTSTDNESSPDKKEPSQDEKSKSAEIPPENESSNPKKEGGAKYPRGVPFILVYKFCERFSFYTFFVILTLYIHQELNFDEKSSPLIYHTFLMVVYSMPILGSFIADSYLAKFWTIIYMSAIYIAGTTLVFGGSSLKNVISMRILSLVGLLMIGVAEGSLKPCSSAFGGDQFYGTDPHRRIYFSLYYFVVYSGHILASFLGPVLRSHVRCFGKENCYPLAIGFAGLMISIGTVVFIMGKPFYVIFDVYEGIIIKVFKCIPYALWKKIRAKDEKKDHWLDYAEEKFDKQLIADIKVLLHVLQVYIPLPINVTLMYQVGSTWVLQGKQMDGEFYGYHIKPDQMVVLLPILVVVMIPTYELIVYPVCRKLGVMTTPLQKIAVGGIFNSLAFFIAAFIQLSIESHFPVEPKAGFGEITVVNNSPCNLGFTGMKNITIKAFGARTLSGFPLKENRFWKITPSRCPAEGAVNQTFLPEEKFQAMMITLDGKTLGASVKSDSRVRTKDGYPRVRLLFSTENENETFIFEGPGSFTIPTNDSKSGIAEYMNMPPGTYEIYLQSNASSSMAELIGKFKFSNGGSYIVYAYKTSSKTNIRSFPTLNSNSVHILYQLPQYIVLASGEQLFVVTGLAFSYAEAPVSMKAIVHACWYLNHCFGNALLLFINLFVQFLIVSHRFFVFASLMFLAVMVFMVITHYYTYIDEENKKS